MIAKRIKDSVLGHKKSTILDRLMYPFLMHVYYPIDSFFSMMYERVTRSLAFAKHGWMHYDFESAFLYDLMAFKLKRIYKVLEDGYGVQEEVDMAALKEAIAICERLFAGNYDEKYLDIHCAKYPMVDIGDPQPERTPEQFEEYRNSLFKLYEDGERDRKVDLDRLNEILKKHEPKWWD